MDSKHTYATKTGRVIEIGQIVTGTSAGTGKSWSKRTFVIQTDEQYPRNIAFDIFGEDKISKINLQMNQLVDVAYDIESRKAKDSWFTTAKAWRVTDHNIHQEDVENTAQPQALPEQQAPRIQPSTPSSDLPF